MNTKASLADTARTADAQFPDLAARADAVAKVAGNFAIAIDRDSRFPEEAFAEIRRQKLLGIMVPKALGGEGASTSEIVDVCYRIGQACAHQAAGARLKQFLHRPHHVEQEIVAPHLIVIDVAERDRVDQPLKRWVLK